MQLSEAEIGQILNDYWPGRDDDTDRSEAAHAIAEKIKEGVEADFEGRWQVDDLGYHVLTISSLNKYQDKRIRIAQIAQGGPPNERDGQLVTVTVSKKEERDGQQT